MPLSEIDGGHVLVVGAGVAGLCAARALADRADTVTVVERDRLPAEPTIRRGVPQAHHLHVLVEAGQRALEQLFPGLIEELFARGAVPVAAPTDVLYLTATGWRERFPATHRLVGVSRELLEWTIRQHLVTGGRVRFDTGHEVTGLITDGAAVTGATVRATGGGPVGRVSADWVIDAGGRGSAAPHWLDALGYGRPEATEIDSGLAYASRRYRLPPAALGDSRNLLLLPEPPDHSRAGVLYPIEGGQWFATLAGIGDQRPPTDEAGFEEFARQLPSPLLAEALAQGEPISPIYGFRRTGNGRRHFDRMPRWPDGFLVVGDADCTFNPVYGHGMSVAARHALTLREWLQDRPDAPAHRVQGAVARTSAAAWLIATGADLRYPTTTGARPGPRERLSHRYLNRVTDVANRDRHVCRALTDVLHLLRPPTSLVRPGVALRVLRGRPGPRLTQPPVSPASGGATEPAVDR